MCIWKGPLGCVKGVMTNVQMTLFFLGFSCFVESFMDGIFFHAEAAKLKTRKNRKKNVTVSANKAKTWYLHPKPFISTLAY